MKPRRSRCAVTAGIFASAAASSLGQEEAALPASAAETSAVQGLAVATPLPDDAQLDGWTLVWSDEFDGQADSPPDPTKWTYDLGAHGWGNNEHQAYTDRTDNAALDGQGHLVITAKREAFTTADGTEAPYTSARLKTQGRYSTQYGRVEARIQLPTGQGIWPAFWMLGDDITTVGWPACGEIDIMEHLGHITGRTTSALHGPGYSAGDALSSHIDLPDGQHFRDGFHTFAIEWSPDAIHFEVDGHRYHTRTPADAAPHHWAYDRPMFLILNIAVGGNWPGYPDETTPFPQRMLVDYVRVYHAEEAADDEAGTLAEEPGQAPRSVDAAE